MIWVMNLGGCYLLPHLWAKPSLSRTAKVGLFVGFLSMGGLPPFLGFFPKWVVVGGLVERGRYVLVVGMVLTTLITLYYYFRVVFVIFIHTNTTYRVGEVHPQGKLQFTMAGVGLVALHGLGLWGCTRL